MKNQLVVIGTGYPDIIREIDLLESLGSFEFKGWLDDNPTLWGKSFLGRAILGPISYLENAPDLVYVNTVALNRHRRHAVELKLSMYENKKLSLVHPSVDTSYCFVGAGAVIANGVHLEPNSRVGEGSMLLPNATVGHDTEIGENCFIASGVNIGGNCVIGDYVWIGAGAMVHPGALIPSFSVVSMGAVVMLRYEAMPIRVFQRPTPFKQI